METITRQFERNQIGKCVENQFLVDEDMNVPDNKPDIKKVVMSDGYLKIDEIKLVEHYLRVIGKIEFQILCETELMEPMYCCLTGKIPFDEMIYVEDTDNNFMVKSKSVDLKTSMIHSRKLRLKAIVEVAVQSEKQKMEEVPLDIISDCNIHKKQENLELLRLHTSKKDVCRIKQEIHLPGTKESMETILWMDVSNRRLDTKLGTEEVHLAGELQVFCFYESPDGKIDWVDQGISYEGKVECSGVDETMYHHMNAELEDVKVEIGVDEDGETRVLNVEGTLILKFAVYEEETIGILRDVYSLEHKCVMETKEAVCEQLVLQNHSKCKVMERISVPELKNNVLQICHSKGRVVVEELKMQEDGILVTGFLCVNFLYVKSNDETPFDTWHGMVPFSHLVECGEVIPELKYDISTMLEQLSVTLQGGNEIEVKAALAFHGFFRKEEHFLKINGIEFQPIPKEEIEKRPSVIGYVVKKNDDLWDLAKRYHTSVEEICKVNELKDGTLNAGDRLLIFKGNMSIL